MQSVIRHDEFDHTTWKESLRLSPRLTELVKSSNEVLPGAAALIEDLFYSFYRPSVTLLEENSLPPSAQVARTILQEIMSTLQWESVRAAGTVSDGFYSGLATATVAKSVLASFDEKLLKKLKALQEAEAEAEKLFAQAETLQELGDQAVGNKAASLYEQAKAARESAEAKQDEAEELAQSLDESTEQIEDAARQAGRESLEAAEAEVESAEAAVQAFTGSAGQRAGGQGSNLGGGNGGGMTLKEKMVLATKVGKSKKLQMVAELAGRLVRIALQTQRTKVTHPPDEIVGVTIGADLGKTLPVELAQLADPDLELIFMKKYVERQLMQLDMRGSEKQGRGPILIALDSSGSMEDPLGRGKATKETWSKGVALALLAIARKQKRDFAVMHFAHAGALEVFEFPKGEATTQELLKTTDFFYRGGTDYHPWMHKALELVEKSKYNRADVICVSDGQVNITAGLEEEWNRRRKARDMRCYGVLLGDQSGIAALSRVSDAIATIDDLTEDNSALQMMFSI